MGLKGLNSSSSESSHVANQMNRKVGHAHTMVIYTMGRLVGVGEVFFNPVGDSLLLPYLDARLKNDLTESRANIWPTGKIYLSHRWIFVTFIAV